MTPIRYAIAPLQPEAHLFAVTVTVDVPDPAGQVFTLPGYLVGLHGMPRRMAVYPNNPSWQTLNQWESIGALMIGISTLLFIGNCLLAWRKPVPAGDNPWDAYTLEWFTTSPPPHHNFYRLPQIRSERPTWDHNHPEAKALGHGKDH